MSIYTKLANIQAEMVTPKDKRNDFGEFQYRTLENINEALKPLLIKYGCTLFFNDEVFAVEGTAYLKTTVTFIDAESGENISIASPCPIDLTHRKMSLEQCGGSSLSYSRKYAVSALLLLDGNQDPDSMPPLSRVEQIKGCKSIKQLQQLWEAADDEERADEVFVQLVKERKKQLTHE